MERKRVSVLIKALFLSSLMIVLTACGGGSTSQPTTEQPSGETIAALVKTPVTQEDLAISEEIISDTTANKVADWVPEMESSSTKSKVMGKVSYTSSVKILSQKVVSNGDNSNDWMVYDQSPLGATIKTVNDAQKGNIIKLTGDGIQNGYVIGYSFSKGSSWRDTTNTNIKWSMKYSEDFIIYVRVNTKEGYRYLFYTNSNKNYGESNYDKPHYIHNGLGIASNDGTWRTFSRDLNADLKRHQPSNEIISVDGFFVRGSGLIDDVELFSTNSEQTNDAMYEDGEDGKTTGWSVYTGSNQGSISSLDDATKSSKVIELNGNGTQTGYILGSWKNTINKNISWEMNYCENYVIYISVETEEGHRFMTYTPLSEKTFASNPNYGRGKQVYGDYTYIHSGLNPNTKSCSWQAVTRDLEADLKKYEPNNSIKYVNAFLVRGSGSVDNIKMFDLKESEGTEEVDTTKPVITLTGANSIELTQGATYTEQGATATDDRDGTVAITTTGTVDVNRVGSYTITYTATDKAGNKAIVTRTVKVVLAPDITKPVITLNGASSVELTQGATYTEQGATATDDRDGNVSVFISGEVDTSTIGEYIITYSAQDKAGNKATKKRTIIVKKSPNTSITISGKIEYERVHATHNGSSSALDYNNITTETAKQIIVKAINGSGQTIATTSTDDNGNYSLTNLPKNTSLKIRVYAKMLKSNKWDVKVIDNTNGNAQYVIEGELLSTGTSNSIRNLKALASTKQSPPFAILDSVYLAMKKVLAADASVVFPPLNMNWTVNNVKSGTYFDGNDNIMIQGDQNSDSDEYDNHVIIHEWGHYFEAKFSRADSIGGSHGSGDYLDIRLAFGEGWGNAWSAIATDDPIYFDTFQSNGWNMNIETASKNNPGWFSEASIQRILYDLYDSNDDGSDTLSLGFKPLYNVFVGAQKTTPAFTSIFSFIKALKDENIDEQGGIDSIVESESIATIIDIWGTGRTNRASSYPYYDLTIGDSVNVSTSSSDGRYNKLTNHQYVKFTIATAGNYTIKVRQTNGTDSDPDFVWYKTSPFTWLNKSDGVPNGGVEETSTYFEEGKYILDIMDANNIANAEYSVNVTPQ